MGFLFCSMKKLWSVRKRQSGLGNIHEDGGQFGHCSDIPGVLILVVVQTVRGERTGLSLG